MSALNNRPNSYYFVCMCPSCVLLRKSWHFRFSQYHCFFFFFWHIYAVLCCSSSFSMSPRWLCSMNLSLAWFRLWSCGDRKLKVQLRLFPWPSTSSHSTFVLFSPCFSFSLFFLGSFAVKHVCYYFFLVFITVHIVFMLFCFCFSFAIYVVSRTCE